MQFNKEISDLYVPDSLGADEALSRTTHLAVGAHQDDLEIFAYHGIAECYQKRMLGSEVSLSQMDLEVQGLVFILNIPMRR